MGFKHFCTSAIIEEGQSLCRSWKGLGVQYIGDKEGLVEWRSAFIDPSSAKPFDAGNRKLSLPHNLSCRRHADRSHSASSEASKSSWLAMRVSTSNIV